MGQLNQGAASLQPEFNACQLHLGGDVGADEVHLLHGVAGLKDSVEVLPGVYVSAAACMQRGAGMQCLQWGAAGGMPRGQARVCVAGIAQGWYATSPLMHVEPADSPLWPSALPLACVAWPQLGGFPAAKQGLGEGRFSADQFKVLTRYAGGVLFVSAACWE